MSKPENKHIKEYSIQKEKHKKNKIIKRKIKAKKTDIEKQYKFDGLCAFCREEEKGCGCLGEIDKECIK